MVRNGSVFGVQTLRGGIQQAKSFRGDPRHNLGGDAAPGPRFADRQQPAGPGDPHIANLRFDPDRVVAGQTAIMSFYFEVPTADIKEAVLLERGIAQFTGRGGVAKRLDGSARALDLLQLGVSKEPDIPAVGRPERTCGAICPGQRGELERVQGADPDLLLSPLDKNRRDLALVR